MIWIIFYSFLIWRFVFYFYPFYPPASCSFWTYTSAVSLKSEILLTLVFSFSFFLFLFFFPICCYLPERFLYRPLLISLYILQPIILNSGEHVDGGKKKESRFVVTFVIPQFLFLTFLHYQATGAHGLEPVWRVLIADHLGLRKYLKSFTTQIWKSRFSRFFWDILHRLKNGSLLEAV